MEKSEIKSVLDALRTGEIKEHSVSKEEFLAFREVLVAQDDFKHFRGIARRGGSCLYQYRAEPKR